MPESDVEQVQLPDIWFGEAGKLPAWEDASDSDPDCEDDDPQTFPADVARLLGFDPTTVEKYSDDEARDDHGRWTEGGGIASGSAHGINEKEERQLTAQERRFLAADKNDADAVREMGAKWIHDVAENDPVFKDLLTKEQELTGKLGTIDKKLDSLGPRMDKMGTKLAEAFEVRTKWLNDWKGQGMEYRNDPEFQRLTADIEKQQAALDKFSNKADALATERGSTYHEREAVSRSAGQAIAGWINRGQPVSLGIGINNHHADPRVESAVRDFERMIGGAPVESHDSQVNIETLGKLSTGAGSGRDCYDYTTNTMYLSPNVDRPTVFHEMGHWLERNIVGGQHASMAFLNSRTRGETAKPLSELTQIAYGRDEVAKPDKFSNPYTGKIYGNATEVLSMGMQYLAENPTRFFVSDRDHFNFTIGMLRAARVGVPWRNKG